MTTIANPLKLLLVLAWFSGCTRTTSPDASSSSNWLSCTTLSDCASAPSAVACKQGYCVDAMGKRVVHVSDAGTSGKVSIEAGAIAQDDAGSTAQLAATCSALMDPNSDSATLANMVISVGGNCILSASDYDQSCTQDSDCVEVGVGDFCVPLACACPNGAINVAAQAQYQADVMRTPPALCSSFYSVDCSCACGGVAHCNGGQCELLPCGQAVDAGQL